MRGRFRGGAISLQETDRLVVATWLDDVDAEIPAVLEVAALAFVVGVAERTFEFELGAQARIAEFVPEIDTASKEARAEIDLRFRQLRKHRSDHQLLTVRQILWPGDQARFRSGTWSSGRRRTASTWWPNCGAVRNDFWVAIRRWLQDIATDDYFDLGRNVDLLNTASIGLALLGLVAPDEVLDSYLGPWTAEDASLNEQTMAVYLVWQMSMLDQLAPLALHSTFLGRPRFTDPAQVGDIRVQRPLARYPLEAVKRLSQLADQGETLAARAYAQLFATLAGQDSDAVVVLGEMCVRMNTKRTALRPT